MLHFADEGELARNTELVLHLLETAIESPPSDANGRLDGHAVHFLLEQLQKNPNTDVKRLATIEWLLLPNLGRYSTPPATLQKLLSREPEFLIELLKTLYLPRHRENNEDMQAEAAHSEREKQKAEKAWRLLHEWRLVPGTKEDGTVDEAELFRWVATAREKAREVDRLEVCDSTIGEVLSHSPPEPDGSWPCVSVRNLIESVESIELERGFAIGIRNKRGIHSKRIGEGGDQERALAAKYAAIAASIRNRAPRTSAALLLVAEGYEEEAKREDIEAEAES